MRANPFTTEGDMSIIEGKQSKPNPPSKATESLGELPGKPLRTEGIKKFSYKPKVKSEIGDSGKG